MALLHVYNTCWGVSSTKHIAILNKSCRYSSQSSSVLTNVTLAQVDTPFLFLLKKRMYQPDYAPLHVFRCHNDYASVSRSSRRPVNWPISEVHLSKVSTFLKVSLILNQGSLEQHRGFENQINNFPRERSTRIAHKAPRRERYLNRALNSLINKKNASKNVYTHRPFADICRK